MQNMVMSPETGLAVFEPFRFLSALEPIMASINYATLNFITIGAVFLIGIELGILSRSMLESLLKISTDTIEINIPKNSDFGSVNSLASTLTTSCIEPFTSNVGSERFDAGSG